MIQQLGLFDVDNSAQCDKAKEGADGTTNAELLVHGALMCCKSKEPDQSFCKRDKCVSGMMKCMHTLGDKMEAIEEKLTNPKAMERDDDGQMRGSCPIAIKNRVEGALCCGAEMKNMAACVQREVGDYKECEDSWNKAFESADFFDTATAVMESFDTGGYCAGTKPKPTTPSGCPKCGKLKKSGKRSCCAPGGAWFKNCGGSGDSKFDHTWAEGAHACAGERSICAIIYALECRI